MCGFHVTLLVWIIGEGVPNHPERTHVSICGLDRKNQGKDKCQSPQNTNLLILVSYATHSGEEADISHAVKQ